MLDYMLNSLCNIFWFLYRNIFLKYIWMEECIEVLILCLKLSFCNDIMNIECVFKDSVIYDLFYFVNKFDRWVYVIMNWDNRY